MKYQVIIIGGGPAGYTAAEAAGKGGLSVLLIEKSGWRLSERRLYSYENIVVFGKDL